MSRAEITRWFFLTIFVQIIIIAIVLIYFFDMRPGIFGNAVIQADGGNITRVEIAFEDPHIVIPWHGYYGNASNETGARNDSGFENRTEHVDIFTKNLCFAHNDSALDKLIFISDKDSIDLHKLIPSTKEDYEAFLSMNDSKFYAAKAFDSKRNFSLYGIDYELDTAYLRSKDDSIFAMGIMTDGSNFVLVVEAQENKTGFDGRAVTYQAMVPVIDAIETYYFHTNRLRYCEGCEVELLPGWNYITLCDQFHNDSIEDIFANIKDDLFFISEWEENETVKLNARLLYNNSFSEINQSKGQFVYVPGNKNIVLRPQEYTLKEQSITLSRYWNSVSRKFDDPQTINGSFESVLPYLQFVQKFNATEQKLEAHSPQSADNHFETVESGEGLFIYFTDDEGILTYRFEDE